MRLAPPPDFLNPTPTPRTPDASIARPFIRRALRVLRTVAVVGAVAFAVLAWTTRSSNPNVIRSLRDSSAVRSVFSLLRSPTGELRGEDDDRISVLLLGIGGEGHEGPLLTDTILLATIRPSAGRIILASIPRDLAIPLEDGRTEKANAVNAYAERDDPGSGGNAIRRALAPALGVDIPYYVRVDFAGFAGLIDELDGVDVEVERAFEDSQYPIRGKEDAPWEERFERLVIPAGRVHMDGARALKYVRSRHGTNGEASDFARARRQQRLLFALRDRLSARALAASPTRLLALRDAWRAHVATNLDPPQLLRLASIAQRIADRATLERVVFTDAPGGELTSSITNGAYVLQPRDRTFGQVRRVMADAIAGTRAPSPRSAPAPVSTSAPVAIVGEIWNGTTINGFATRIAELIAEREGIAIGAVRNAPARNVIQTMIYHRPMVDPNRIARLRALLNAESSTIFPDFTRASSGAPALSTNTPRPDLLIVLGESSAPTQALSNGSSSTNL